MRRYPLINRLSYLYKITEAFEIGQVCAILGPRQTGKTTLAQEFAKTLPEYNFYDLENPQDLTALDSPSLVLPTCGEWIIIDEIQRRPELFPYVRHLVDTSDKKFLILGSASQNLIQQSSETLAGRIHYIHLPPFRFDEIDDWHKLWIRGGFPNSYLSSTSHLSEKWRMNYIKTFLERDLSMMGINVLPMQMRRLWNMLAHYHGQIANISELKRSLDLADKTVKRYIDILEACFMVRQLQPWHENLSKRQVKRPKIYVRDSGILHSLLGINEKTLYGHPKLGASWEGYVIENIINLYDDDLCEFYFWQTEKGAELDLLVIKGEQRLGYEFKFSDHPKTTKSMRIALTDLNLDSLTIVTPGEKTYALAENIRVISINELIHSLEKDQL